MTPLAFQVDKLDDARRSSGEHRWRLFQQTTGESNNVSDKHGDIYSCAVGNGRYRRTLVHSFYSAISVAANGVEEP